MPATKAQPLDSYPVAFHAAVRTGEGAIWLENLPWSGVSSQRRFQTFIRLLRLSQAHPLGEQARARLWHVRVEGGLLRISSRPKPAPDTTAPVLVWAVDKALRNEG